MKLARRDLAVGAATFAIVGAVYLQTASFEFLNFDDDDYVTANPVVRRGLTLNGLRWALTSGHASNWHPLTWLSHMLDVELFGLAPGPHHLVNAGLHAANAALLYVALQLLTGRRGASAFVALTFGLHPARAESVAWVAERKDVLAGLFWMLALIAYARYARSPSFRRHLAVGVAFAAGLLSKPMGVTLPAVLLLLDAWPLGRWAARGRRLWREKAPWFALALTSAGITFLVQRKGGAVHPLFGLGLSERVSNAVVSYARYLVDTFIPHRLAAFYPHPALQDPEGHRPWSTAFLVSLALLAAISLLAFRRRRRNPALAVGWAWYLGTLLPVIGLVQVGLQGRADRYTYLPSIGLWIAVAFGLDTVLGDRVRLRGVVRGAAALYLALMGALSWRQVGTWHDSETVFRNALTVTDNNFLAWTNLAQTLQARGELDEAEELYRRALDLRPGLFPVRTNLAQLLHQQRRFAEARTELERALATAPDYAPAHAQLGFTLAALRQDAAAVASLRRALQLDPANSAARNQLAWILATSADPRVRDPVAALAQVERLLSLAVPPPGFTETRAAALAANGRFEQAVRLQAQAVAETPAAHRALARRRLELYRAARPYVQPP